MAIPSVYVFDPSAPTDLQPRLGLVAIYGLFDPRDLTLRYIGKATHPYRRWYSHMAPHYRDRNTHVSRWVRLVLDAGQRPIMQIIEWVGPTHWVTVERAHIAAARAEGHRLTNITNGGEGRDGPRPSISQQTRARLSASHKGKKHAPGWSELMSAKMRGKNTRTLAQGRKPTSPEARANNGAGHKGLHVSEETRAKISAAHRGRKKTPEHLAHLGASLKGHPWSEKRRAAHNARKERTIERKT